MQYIPLLVVCTTIGGSTVGCASIPLTYDQCNATQYVTALEHEQCLLAASKYKEEQYEREDKRLVRRDKLIAFLNACDAAPGLVILEKRSVGRSVLPNSRQQANARKEYGYPYTHNNVSSRANKIDLLCVDVREMFRQPGY